MRFPSASFENVSVLSVVTFVAIFWMLLLMSGCEQSTTSISKNTLIDIRKRERDEGYASGFADGHVAGAEWAKKRYEAEWNAVIEESAKHGRVRMEKENDSIGKAR